MAQSPTTILRPRGLHVERIGTNRAKVVVEPLERGFGHTLGNALRRVLLSSIPGAAVVEVPRERVRTAREVVSEERVRAGGEVDRLVRQAGRRRIDDRCAAAAVHRHAGQSVRHPESSGSRRSATDPLRSGDSRPGRTCSSSVRSLGRTKDAGHREICPWGAGRIKFEDRKLPGLPNRAFRTGTRQPIDCASAEIRRSIDGGPVGLAYRLQPSTLQDCAGIRSEV